MLQARSSSFVLQLEVEARRGVPMSVVEVWLTPSVQRSTCWTCSSSCQWIQRGLGSVHLAQFDESGSAEGGPARRLVVATLHNVLAVLNTKNGEIMWRHVLPVGPTGTIESLMVQAGKAYIVTDNPPLLRAFDVHTGALMKEVSLKLPFKPESMYGRRLVLHETSSVTVAHLTAGAVEVSRFSNLKTGALEWQHSISQPWISPQSQCGLTGTSLTCVDASLGLVLTLPFTSLPSKKGAARDLTFVSTSLQSLGVSVASSGSEADCPYNPAPLTLQPLHGSQQHLLITSDDSSVVLRLDSDGVVTTVKETGVSPRALSITDVDQPEHAVLYKAVQDRQAVRISGFSVSAGTELVSRSLSFSVGGAAGVRALAVQQYHRRGDGEVGVRALVVMEDDSIHMVASPGVLWSREEALASVLAVETVDLPIPASSVSMHDHMSQRAGVLHSLAQRVMLQGGGLLAWFAEWLEDSLSPSQASPDSPPQLYRDEFNIHKLLIIATAPGKVFALDNLSGAVVWSEYLPAVQPLPSQKMLLFLQRSVAHFPHPPQMVLVAMHKGSCEGVVHTFNPLTGESTGKGLQVLPYRISQTSMLAHNDQQFVKPLLVVDTDMGVHAFPSGAEQSVVLPNKHVLYVATRNSTHITGHSLRGSTDQGLSLTPLWSQHFPPGTIDGVYLKRPGDKVHSAGRVMADRSVLYKYTNPNLAVVVSRGFDHINKNTLSVYLVDLVSGAVVDWVSHSRVSGPIHVIHSENWVVYTYHNDKYRRHELHSLELFEGPKQANATAFSSLSGAQQQPLVEHQAYILPHGVQAAAHTVTEKSITTKCLLLALQTGGVAQVARLLVDPRRPLSAAGPREENLIPYVPEVHLPPTEIISYNQTLPRVTAIYSAPTGLESTSIVFVYGLDLFFSRVFPSKMFDMLKDDFDYVLIVGALTLLVAAAFITRKLAQRKALYHQWK
ncbi:Pyrrolo-quinoline quinone repeat [Trinorchestia longiramus]|nr:Pyrrolo-quinoline quinone repeat [Trinorchestia longiramus]